MYHGSHHSVVAEEFVAQQYQELTVKKNTASLSGEGYTIKDPQDNALFKMDGHFFSVRDRCVLKNAADQPVLCARKKIPSAHERWDVFRGDNFDQSSKLFSVRKASIVGGLKTHLKVFLGDEEKEESPFFEIKGNFLERDLQIYQGDNIVAEVKRKFSAGDVLLDKHTFVTKVQPGVDQALVGALIIIMDRIHED